MNCPNCNFQIDGGQKFCPKCGNPLLIGSIQAPPENPYQTATENAPKPKKKGLKIFLIVGSIVIVCAIAAAILIFVPCITGHNFLHEQLIAPTCTEDGYMYYACTNKGCNETYTEPLTGDEWKAGHKWLEATCTTPKTCSACGATEGTLSGHTLENGLCKNCTYVSPDLLKDFSDTVDAVVATIWYVSYQTMPHADDITMEFDKVEFNNGKYYTECFAFVNYDDETYGASIKMTYKWNEKNQTYVRESSENETFFVVSSDRSKINYLFTNDKNFVHRRTGLGLAKSVLSFKPDGTVTQYVYDYYGYLVSTGPATYNMYKTPSHLEIAMTATSNGHVNNMIYVTSGNKAGISWQNDIYLSE